MTDSPSILIAQAAQVAQAIKAQEWEKRKLSEMINGFRRWSHLLNDIPGQQETLSFEPEDRTMPLSESNCVVSVVGNVAPKKVTDLPLREERAIENYLDKTLWDLGAKDLIAESTEGELATAS